MPKRKITYSNRLVRGDYAQKYEHGRSDTYHMKIVVDSVEYFPYFPQRQATSTGTTYTQCYDIPMNSPLDALYISSIGTASNAFAQTTLATYWVPQSSMQYDTEAILLAGKYYERFMVTSNKIEFFFKAEPPRINAVQIPGGAGGTLPVLDDYALNGPSEVSWTLIGVGPNQNHSEFQGNQRLMMQQPGARVVRMSRGPNTSSNLTKANYANITAFSSLTKWQGKSYAAGDGGYLQNISNTGVISSTYPTIRPKWILGCTWRVTEDPDGTERIDWTVLARVRNTFFCTFQLRRTYPHPTLSLLSEEEKAPLLALKANNSACDLPRMACYAYLKRTGDEFKDLESLSMDDDDVLTSKKSKLS